MRAIILILLLAGCSDHWMKLEATQRQGDVDSYLCQYENKNFSDGSVIGPHGDLAQQEMIRQCMKAKGYRLD
jgi:hypothetical protein